MAPSKCVGALLARNEAAPDRYLKRVLANAKTFCDEIVVLDDGSTDDTAKLCRDAGCIVHEREQGVDVGWWGGGERTGESPARQQLWALAAERAGPDGWVYVFDADMELIGITPSAFRMLLKATNANSWAWPLLDCWNDDQHHRVDGQWVAWRTPRVWLARAMPTPNFVPRWSERAIHCGHLPENYPCQPGLAPAGTAWLHLGYITEKQRVAKREKYLKLQQPA